MRGSKVFLVAAIAFALAMSSASWGAPTLKTLASFNSANGKDPDCSLVMDSKGNLYGTALEGGANSTGTVFELPNGSSTIGYLSFNGTNGAYPTGNLILDGSGNLYGTSQGDDNHNDGTVFEVPAGFGTITTLASFNGANGSGPQGNVVADKSGNLYGFVSNGNSNPGAIFELPAGSGTITTLATVPSGPQNDIIIDGNGNLYGTNGSQSPYSIFELLNGTGTIESLASASFPLGRSFGGLLMDASGDLYGADGGSSVGPYPDGAIFELPAGSGTVSALASFNGTNGISPNANLIMDAKGDLFGTTYTGTVSGEGTVFELPAGSSTIKTLVTFNGSNGLYCSAGLIADTEGNLYGTTVGGGANNVPSTIFEVTGSGFVVPEPSCFVIASLGGAGLLVRRRARRLS
jgi:uncharacterized repeat protein (TIGR03803 family)